jgi:hypothetical protein
LSQAEQWDHFCDAARGRIHRQRILLLLIPFWRFVNEPSVAEEIALAPVRRLLDQFADWFVVPEHVYFHSGHAWARFDDGQLVTVGMNDFAQKLVGDLSAVSLPAPGSRGARRARLEPEPGGEIYRHVVASGWDGGGRERARNGVPGGRAP